MPGFKTNLADIPAAIALVQLDKLPAHAAIREQQFATYDAALSDSSLRPLERVPGAVHAFHLYVVRALDRQRELTAAFSRRGRK